MIKNTIIYSIVALLSFSLSLGLLMGVVQEHIPFENKLEEFTIWLLADAVGSICVVMAIYEIKYPETK